MVCKRVRNPQKESLFCIVATPNHHHLQRKSEIAFM